jgi:hypothetical protein
MYWGETFVNLPGPNLSDWNSLLDESGELKKAMLTCPEFDSDPLNVGVALITDKGIY